jgi:hypothetical protein
LWQWSALSQINAPARQSRVTDFRALDDRFHETAQFSFPGLSGKMLEFREPNMIRILEALV